VERGARAAADNDLWSGEVWVALPRRPVETEPEGLEKSATPRKPPRTRLATIHYCMYNAP
jgi:hypothetical protein